MWATFTVTVAPSISTTPWLQSNWQASPGSKRRTGGARPAQRHEGRRRTRAALTPPRRGVAPDGVMPALAAEPAKVLEDPKQRHPLPGAPRRVDGRQPIEVVPPRAELRLRLDAALVFEGGLLGRQHLSSTTFRDSFGSRQICLIGLP
jgi:hypothetical protein